MPVPRQDRPTRLAVALELEELRSGGLGHDHAVDGEEARGAGEKVEALRSVAEGWGFDAPGMDDAVDA